MSRHKKKLTLAAIAVISLGAILWLAIQTPEKEIPGNFQREANNAELIQLVEVDDTELITELIQQIQATLEQPAQESDGNLTIITGPGQEVSDDPGP